MRSKRCQRKIFHINMLGSWHTLENVSYPLEAGSNGNEVEFPFCKKSPVEFKRSWRNSTINSHHEIHQQRALETVLEQFGKVVQDVPGRTSIVAHEIHTGATKPIRQRPCRLPFSERDKVKQELLQHFLYKRWT